MKEINSVKIFFKRRISASELTEQIRSQLFAGTDGRFCNLEATNQKGKFDLKTFEIHLKPNPK
jgi:hypothetical protein